MKNALKFMLLGSLICLTYQFLINCISEDETLPMPENYKEAKDHIQKNIDSIRDEEMLRYNEEKMSDLYFRNWLNRNTKSNYEWFIVRDTLTGDCYKVGMIRGEEFNLEEMRREFNYMKYGADWNKLFDLGYPDESYNSGKYVFLLDTAYKVNR